MSTEAADDADVRLAIDCVLCVDPIDASESIDRIEGDLNLWWCRDTGALMGGRPVDVSEAPRGGGAMANAIFGMSGTSSSLMSISESATGVGGR